MSITFSKRDTRSYAERLTGKIYKILPICETNLNTKDTYIESLIFELLGGFDTLHESFSRTEYMSVINTLSELRNVDYDPVIYRREVFKCIRIVQKVGGLIEY